MKKWTMPLAVGLAAVLVGASQLALPGDGENLHARFGRLVHGEAAHAHGIEAHLDAAAESLGLSASQRKEVAVVLRAALPGIESSTLKLIEAHAEQIERVHAAELDLEALRAASARVGAVQGDLAVAVARLLHDVHRVLTPEQKERLVHLHDPGLLDTLAQHVRGLGSSVRAWADRQ